MHPDKTLSAILAVSERADELLGSDLASTECHAAFNLALIEAHKAAKAAIEGNEK